MVIQELEQQLLRLSPNDKLHIIQLLAQSLALRVQQFAGTETDPGNCFTTENTHPEEPTKLSEFFRQSPLAEISEELDLSRERSLPRDAFTP
jgi:hypothetical protein